MKIKKGDTVQIMVGKDAGKTGKVMQILPKDNQVVVENMHQITKHMKPQKSGEKGQRFTFSAPMRAANVQLVCPKCGKPTRIGTKVLTDGKHQRMCRKCKETI